MIDSIKLSQELIRCKSVTPIDDGAIDLLISYLEPLGFKCHKLEFSDAGSEPVVNLYARLGTTGKNFCFAGHTDVVPTGDGWQHDPFAAIIENGVLYGRGAVDMKPAIAAFIAASAEYVQENKNSISLLITGDEEGDAVNGTPKLLDWLRENNEQIDACIVGEPTNPETVGEMIKIGRRGSVNFALTVQGKQGHVAYPHNAENPFPALTAILAKLQSHDFADSNEFFAASNLEVTAIHSDNGASNVIPATARSNLNIRFNDTHTSAELIEFVEEICNSVTDDYELSYRVSGESFIGDAADLAQIVSSAVRKVTNHTPTLSTEGGTSDARFIKNICPVVEFGLINKTAHQKDEHVATADITTLQQVYLETLRGYFSA
jgi:succinyl-diaminopimelate desuccinylase